MLSEKEHCQNDITEGFGTSFPNDNALKQPFVLAAGYFGCALSTSAKHQTRSTKWVRSSKEVKRYQEQYISSLNRDKAA